MSSQLQPSLAGLSGMARRLVSEGVMPEDVVRKAMADSSQQKATLGAWLLDRSLVDSAELTRIASAEFGMPMMDVAALNPATMPLDLISEALITKHQALPLFRRGKRLYVGIADPMQSHALDEIKFHSNCMVEPILVERGSLQRVIESLLNNMRNTMPDMGGGDLDELDIEGGDDEGESSSGVDANANDDAPVVKFVNKILVDAIRRGASDIHFEPFETQYRVRLRMDGMLKAVANPPMKMANRISSRIKVMAQLDIAEKRVPQDGRIKLNLSKTRAVDFRVSTLPTLFGEKIVLRILDGSSARIGIEKLGYEPNQQKLYVDAIHKPYGMVLVTGPTGSGKTVSLYTGLNMLNTAERNISTVEDPVEIRVEGINQVQQNVKRGMTFASALRSFLRQDPDVIMVGEIRDLETAEIAIKAAQTGHMVLSTLHTNDAAQTISRLMNMGIAPYNITSSVTLIIAQRLARRLHDCKKPIELPPKVLLDAGFTQADIDAGLTIYEAVGCDSCNEGYKGRVGIYQVMPMLEDIQKIILQGGNALQIAEVAKAAGINDLRASALLKVKQGLTSLTEIDRVTKE
ncbi:type IV-A pilus assembly ATPase PilB [Rhodanobacter denitrificans]|uniref:Type IV-A pilus assembly ATPase PilB n=1 Tax=Rhodanobacter thiooxydans TaxID=416169 RepID=A0A154QKD4_9GAMM|nr:MULTISPECIES: type IV-A pilus assembly ATPase PilB [Rhodanobacter]EIL97149.1 type IV-A pilus assembly ATPase PilB [Rhodanobacter thiooxydans LCS2]EIL99435.1 type IV-A pilus assembly ATPase PilB [Rhodanobacter denitrificans]KZC24754.1 type IV-A pilus assembly ATPase PilB [Rhodanobacter thiooxydans]UJJ59255.1 type IV-A pilus assembly ATPase PilB [Rhodanobacter denitrificans]UJM89719.1 type IV-A pilus assembly ATPase PilB [Rhodanobacter denitrificans]